MQDYATTSAPNFSVFICLAEEAPEMAKKHRQGILKFIYESVQLERGVRHEKAQELILETVLEIKPRARKT